MSLKMKTSIRLVYISMVILIVTGITSCKKNYINNGVGTIEFSMDLPALLKSVNIDSGIVSYQLLISVEDTKGNAILTDKLVPLYTFGTSFVSEKVELQTGEFRLTKFMVVDPTGAIIYASPKAGSPLAYLITKPLPMNFNIISAQNTPLVTEVLVVGDQSPSQFGYATFGIQIIKPLDFYTYCILDNPLSMTDVIQMTSAKLTISNNNGWIYSFNLVATSNHLIIRGGSTSYTFLLEKEGYASQTFQFNSPQLLVATKENPLVLKIPVGSTVTKTLFLQPGPDKGKDAMILNTEPDNNYGSYKYFEASYLPSETAITVMKTRRSLIWFDRSALPANTIVKKVVLKLSYDIPLPWDSTIFVSPNSITPVKAAGILQQIVEPWEESKVTWNNQPKTIEAGQIYLQPFSRNVNFIEIDVTSLFTPPAATTLPNYGIMFKLYPNERFKGFRFASSDYPDSLLRPRLSIQYTSAK
jgi:hypothetical protein